MTHPARRISVLKTFSIFLSLPNFLLIVALGVTTALAQAPKSDSSKLSLDGDLSQEIVTVSPSIRAHGGIGVDHRMARSSSNPALLEMVARGTRGKSATNVSTESIFVTDGTGTTGRMAKWMDGDTLGDAASYETNGLTFFGTNHSGQVQPLFNGAHAYHVLEIGATGSRSPLTLAGGTAVMEMWRDLGGGTGAPAAAVSYGMATPGTAVTDDLVVATYKAGLVWNERVRVKNDTGNVGIGIAIPVTKLHVAGSITVDGTINAKYQDVAEWVPASRALPAGTVVTLDPTKSNHVEASSKAYDTRVAGVISAQPGIALGEQGGSKVLVATTGRVRIKVDASHGPIQVGDLLVTSNIPGVAMKSEPVNIGGVQFHRPGTLIGKALEPLAKGRGEILVLLSLQ